MRRTELRSARGLRSRKPLAPTSPKRRAELAIYRRLRDEFLAQYPVCQRCHREPSELHHARGRVGADLTDVSTFRALGRECHRFVTENPRQAIAEGWSLPRIGRAA